MVPLNQIMIGGDRHGGSHRFPKISSGDPLRGGAPQLVLEGVIFIEMS
jgi:hypothetical protein